ncbi:OprO/OprP family phosphate-selective porin [Pontiella sulfatireligans]|uniref:Porin O n=1 Tax=Pontiella sulfatireligans TaxID=2750658 RepID=A0A6C2UIM5_9BACT|nr:porin [Pontiella sulfatireligans]VGO20065.1 Porin O [Pontiella sulfatireligans]
MLASKKIIMWKLAVFLLGATVGFADKGSEAVAVDPPKVDANLVTTVEDVKEATQLAEAIDSNDTNLVAVAIAQNKTNIVEAARAISETNFVASVKADEDAGSWESIFSKENRSRMQVNFYLKDGLYYELKRDNPSDKNVLKSIFSEKRRITGRVGAKVHIDAGGFHSGGDMPDVNHNSTTRRIRLSTYGRTYLFRPLTYGVEYGVSNGDYSFSNGYLWFHEIPYVNSLKVGLFKAPMSLEYMQSSSSTLLMERAAPVGAFVPGERLGFQIGGQLYEGKGTLLGGFFGQTADDKDGDTSDSYSRFVSRGTWLVMDRPESKELVHLGISSGFQFSQGDGTRYRARPGSYLAPHLVDTGELGGDQAFTYALEAAWAKGPFTVQGEFFNAFADDEADDTHDFFGGYIMGSVFLTGDSRPYNRSNGTFGRVKLKRKFSFKDRHLGALELTARASYIDLTDGAVQGGKMSVLSTGFNCYLTQQNRLMLVLGGANVDKPDSNGELYFVQTRFQVEF